MLAFAINVVLNKGDSDNEQMMDVIRPISCSNRAHPIRDCFLM